MNCGGFSSQLEIVSRPECIDFSEAHKAGQCWQFGDIMEFLPSYEIMLGVPSKGYGMVFLRGVSEGFFCYNKYHAS